MGGSGCCREHRERRGESGDSEESGSVSWVGLAFRVPSNPREGAVKCRTSDETVRSARFRCVDQSSGTSLSSALSSTETGMSLKDFAPISPIDRKHGRRGTSRMQYTFDFQVDEQPHVESEAAVDELEQ